MNISSPKITLTENAAACYAYLSDPANYKELMPESTQKFDLNEMGGFLFQLKGMPVIPLKLDEKTPTEKVVWGSANPNFKFTLTVSITELAADQSEVQLLFNGDFNPMISMMAKRPLEKFIQTLSENLNNRGIQ